MHRQFPSSDNSPPLPPPAPGASIAEGYQDLRAEAVWEDIQQLARHVDSYCEYSKRRLATREQLAQLSHFLARLHAYHLLLCERGLIPPCPESLISDTQHHQSRPHSPLAPALLPLATIINSPDFNSSSQHFHSQPQSASPATILSIGAHSAFAPYPQIKPQTVSLDCSAGMQEAKTTTTTTASASHTIDNPTHIPNRQIPVFTESMLERRCQRCGATETITWRRGPEGMLCNSCGLRHWRKQRRMRESAKQRQEQQLPRARSEDARQARTTPPSFTSNSPGLAPNLENLLNRPHEEDKPQ